MVFERLLIDCWNIVKRYLNNC